jgi:hypothetical protein
MGETHGNNSKKPYPQCPKNMCKTILKNNVFDAEKRVKKSNFADIRKLWKITKF